MLNRAVADLGELGPALAVLSAMITPAILILATGSILATTSQRLGRVVERVRELSPTLEDLAAHGGPDAADRRKLLHLLLRNATKRARLLQKASTRLYLAISLFILTSMAIGVVALTRFDFGWLALLFGFFGAGLLLSASVMLIFESRIALSSTYAEMDFLAKRGERFLPPEIMKEMETMKQKEAAEASS